MEQSGWLVLVQHQGFVEVLACPPVIPRLMVCQPDFRADDRRRPCDMKGLQDIDGTPIPTSQAQRDTETVTVPRLRWPTLSKPLETFDSSLVVLQSDIHVREALHSISQLRISCPIALEPTKSPILNGSRCIELANTLCCFRVDQQHVWRSRHSLHRLLEACDGLLHLSSLEKVLRQLRDHLFSSDRMPAHHQRLRGTCLRTKAAVRAAAPVDDCSLRGPVYGLVRTHLGAVAAPDAVRREEGELRLGGNALRVVAPGTVQRTALEEDRGANPGAIVHCEALEVEDDAVRGVLQWTRTSCEAPNCRLCPPAR